MRKSPWKDLNLDSKHVSRFFKLIQDGTLNRSIAKRVLRLMLITGASPDEILQTSDEDLKRVESYLKSLTTPQAK